MIVRHRDSWFTLLFAWKGSVLPEILPRLVFLWVLSSVVTYFHGSILNYKIALNPAPFTLMGVALALFLGFRNSVAYDRFWEARKLWGALLNDSRSLARQALTLSGLASDSEETKYFLQLIKAFVQTAKHQLRHSDATADMQRLLPEPLVATIQKKKFKPVILLHYMSNWIQERKKMGAIDSITLTIFDKNLCRFSDIIGGCERIASTPIPFPYTVLYCVLLPFGLVDSIGWMTPIITVFIAYTFIAFDAIVAQLEDPFGSEQHDLALNTMSANIEASILEMTVEKGSLANDDAEDIFLD
jgi:putative membrane protein